MKNQFLGSPVSDFLVDSLFCLKFFKNPGYPVSTESQRVLCPVKQKQEQKTKVGRVKGSYRKHRGGIVNHQTQEVSTAQVSFAIDYRAAFMNVNVVELNGQQYEVKDTTNVGFENHTIIFDLELAQS